MHETFGFVVATSARPRSEKCAWYVRNQSPYKTNTDVWIIIVLISTLTTAPDRPPAQQGTLLGATDEPASTSSSTSEGIRHLDVGMASFARSEGNVAAQNDLVLHRDRNAHAYIRSHSIRSQLAGG